MVNWVKCIVRSLRSAGSVEYFLVVKLTGPYL